MDYQTLPHVRDAPNEITSLFRFASFRPLNNGFVTSDDWNEWKIEPKTSEAFDGFIVVLNNEPVYHFTRDDMAVFYDLFFALIMISDLESLVDPPSNESSNEDIDG